MDTDCNIIISGATCALPLGYCQCPAGHTFNAGVTKCIKGKSIVVVVAKLILSANFILNLLNFDYRVIIW